MNAHVDMPVHPTARVFMLPVALVVFRNELKAYLRNRMAVFWVFVFPLLVFVTLGFSVGTDLGTLDVRVVDLDRTPTSKALIKQVERSFAASRLLRTHVVVEGTGAPSPSARTVVRMTIPAGFGERIASRGAPATVALTHQVTLSPPLYVAVQTIERSTIDFANAAHATPQLVAVTSNGLAAQRALTNEAAPGQGAAQRFDQFLFSGVIVLMLMSGGMLSLPLALAGQREQKMYRYNAVWPLPPGVFLAGVIGARVTVMLAASVLFLAMGAWVFAVSPRFAPAHLAAALTLVLAGGLLFASIGFLVAATARTVTTAELVGNLLYYPMLLLGDITVPLRQLPFELDRYLRWLPPAQLADGLRQVLFGPGDLAWPWGLLTYLAAVSLLLFFLGQRTFRFQLKTIS